MDWRYRSGNQQHRSGRNKGCRWHQQCLQDCVVSLVCSPTLWNDNFILSPPSSKLLSLLFSQYTNIQHHHHHHHHQLRPRSQSLLLNPAHYSPSSFFIHSSFISSIPSSPIHAQAFPIFRTIFLDPSSPLSAILSLPSSLLNFSQELSVLTASIFFFFFFFTSHSLLNLGCPCGWYGKESTCQCRRPGFSPWVKKIPWRREWLPTPEFLPGESHGQRRLAGYSPWESQRVGHD